ncbi:MAG: hypothetical protein RPR40_00550 [Bermanella sp.]
MNDLIQCMLSGQDLYVVLKNRFGEKYVESYSLPTVILHEGRFWGKFSNVHSTVGHFDLENSRTLSYAYNNFSEVVCTVALNSFTHRFYSSNVYSSVDFICKGRYEKIFDNYNRSNVSLLSEAVRSGLRLKVIIKGDDGYRYIVPIHTLEVFLDDDRFNMETDFDGFPSVLKNYDWVNNLSQDFNDSIGLFKPPSYPGTRYFHKQDFFLTSFLWSGTCMYKREVKENKIIDELFEYETIEIFAEVL